MNRCIATASDSKYFPALMALLRSLRRTNPQLPVVVFDGGLTRRQVKTTGKFAEVIPVKPFMELAGKGKFSYIGNATLLKFEVSSLDAEEVLFLDADTVVLEDLAPLFSFPAGTVRVMREVTALKNIFRPRHRKLLTESLDLEWEMPAFNAGIFVLRPGEWRDLPDKARKLIDRFGEDVFSKTKDQQLLNIIFGGRTHELPGRYNFSPFYDEEESTEPAVIHYLTGCKPWHRDYPEGHRYWEFRENLSFLDYPAIAIVDARRLVKRFSG